MSDFKWSEKTINKLIDECGCQKATMTGILDNLEELKPLIEQFYDEHIFYLSYWESECAFHGWSWAEDDGTMKNMAKITDGITDKFQEIYALILAGLGERCEED